MLSGKKKHCDALGNVLIGNLGSWYSRGSYSTCANYFNILAYKANLFMAMVFPNGSGLCQQNPTTQLKGLAVLHARYHITSSEVLWGLCPFVDS